MSILGAVERLDELTLAIVKDADGVTLTKLFHATHHWHLIAAAELLRRREAGRSVPPAGFTRSFGAVCGTGNPENGDYAAGLEPDPQPQERP